MSNFLKRGKRAQVIEKKREVKFRTKDVYKILGEMDEVAQALSKEDLIITEENVVEEASKHTKREIGEFEQFLLLGKMHHFYEDRKNKEEEE